MEMQNKRIIWPDIVKGYATIMVLLWHMPETSSYIKMLFAPFFMPIFFFISGYFHKGDDGLHKHVVKKALGLLCPFLIWAFINSVTYSDILFNVYDASFTENIISLLRQKNGFHDDLWFICCLYIAHLFLYVIVKISTKYGILLSFVIALIMFIIKKNWQFVSFWHWDVAAIMQFYMVLGYYSKEKLLVDKLFVYKYKNVLPLLYLLLVCFDYCVWNHHYDVHVSKYGNPLVFLMLSVLGVISCIVISGYGRKMKFIRYLGQNSLVFYAFQIDALYLFYSQIGGRIVNHITSNPFMLYLIEIIFIIIVCLVVSVIVNKCFPIMAGKYRLRLNYKR